jgi:hypothetical protein
MSPEQMNSAAHELRATANMHIGDPVGTRCLAFADALEAMSERVPYAWEVVQGGRTYLLSAHEFTGKSYDCATFTPLYKE